MKRKRKKKKLKLNSDFFKKKGKNFTVTSYLSNTSRAIPKMKRKEKLIISQKKK